MGVVSGGGGSSFNGGTITGALVVRKALAPSTSDKPLDILDPNNVDAEIAIARQVDGSGNENVSLALSSALDGTSSVSLSDDNLDGSVTLSSSASSEILARTATAAKDPALTLGTTSSRGVRFLRDGYFVTKLHAAPDDTSLAAGDCALWFDQTDGAAKLMVKAKQADGTVRTGSVNLA